MQFRIGLAALASLATAALVPGYAAGLGVEEGGLGAGQAAVSSCDDNVSISYAFAAGDAGPRVESVVVTGIDDRCAGGTVAVTLVDTSGAQLAAGSSAIGSTSATVALTGLAPASAVRSAHVAVSA